MNKSKICLDNTKKTLCSPLEFQCQTGDCIPAEWECDGLDDCPDNSDETGCEKAANSCQCGKILGLKSIPAIVGKAVKNNYYTRPHLNDPPF